MELLTCPIKDLDIGFDPVDVELYLKDAFRSYFCVARRRSALPAR